VKEARQGCHYYRIGCATGEWQLLEQHHLWTFSDSGIQESEVQSGSWWSYIVPHISVI